jgi:signal transduction histidine kinase
MCLPRLYILPGTASVATRWSAYSKTLAAIFGSLRREVLTFRADWQNGTAARTRSIGSLRRMGSRRSLNRRRSKRTAHRMCGLDFVRVVFCVMRAVSSSSWAWPRVSPKGRCKPYIAPTDNRLWVGTDTHGVSRIDNPSGDRPNVVNYTTAQGLASNNVLCFTEDASGRLYIGTGRGIDRLDPLTGLIMHYGPADGISRGDMMVAFRDRQGALWFGSYAGGVVRLNPQADPSRTPPAVWISGLRVAGVPQPVSELGETEVPELHLGVGRKRVYIEFFALNFGAGELLQYQYKLEERTAQEWSARSEQRAVDFAGLAPGRYRFSVRAVTADGLTCPAPATVTVFLAAPFWQRWWFIMIAVILAAVTAYGIHRHQLARVLELAQVRTRIATDLHDDIGSSLSQISVLSEVIRQRVGQQPAVAEPLSTIGELSRHLLDSLNEIVWAIDPLRDRFDDLAHRMRRFAGDVCAARELELHCEMPTHHRTDHKRHSAASR